MRNVKLKSSRHIDIGACLFAGIIYGIGLTATVVADRIIEKSNWITTGGRIIAFSFLAIALLILLYHISKKAYETIDHHRNDISDECFSIRNIESYYFYKVFGIILACWLPWFIVRFPGGYDTDTLYQLMKYYGLDNLTNHHPIFSTLTFGFFWRIGDILESHVLSCAIWNIISMIITAGMFSFFAVYLKSIGVKRQIIRGVICFYALFIPISLFAQIMSKETLFGWGWVLFLCTYIEIVRTDGKCLKKKAFVIGMFVTSLFLAITKQTGIYIVIGSGICLCLLKIQFKTHLLALMVCVYLTNTLWLGFSETVLKVKFDRTDYYREMVSVPSQQVSLLLRTHRDELTAEDKEILESVFYDINEMADKYNPVIANGRTSWKRNIDFKTRWKFFLWWGFSHLRWPDVFISAFIANSYPALWIRLPFTHTVITSIVMQDSLSSKEIGKNRDRIIRYAQSKKLDVPSIMEEMDRIVFSEVRRPEVLQHVADAAQRTVNFLDEILLLSTCGKALFSLWLPLFAIGYAIHKYNLRLLVFILPEMIYCVTLFVAPAVVPRYVMPMVYAAPVIFVGMLIESRKMTN